jgi:hypothetical protein
MGMRVWHRRLRGSDVLRRVLQGGRRGRGHALSHLRPRDVRPFAFALALVFLITAIVGADVYVMTDGDKITGKTVSLAAGFYKVDTVYGRIAIPKGRVAKVVHDDGREEILNSVPVAVSPEAAPAATGIHLVVVMTGASFWQAWREGEVADPSLRLQISLDEEIVATYVDAKPDPEIPGATVNSFSFAPEDTSLVAGDGARVEPPDTRPGRITLKVDVPADRVGERRFRLAYQANDGPAGAPAWRDLVDTLIHVTLKTETPCIVEIKQNQGKMEFSGFGKKKMRNVETFLIEAKTQ